MYEGKLVRLREMRAEDAEKFTAWMNDKTQAEKLSAGAMPLTLEQEKAWIAANAGRQETHNHFSVETLDGRLIGSCSYHQLDWKNRRCMVGWQIGDPEMRGKGCGTDLIETLLSVLLQTALGSSQVCRFGVFEFNEAARLYELAGLTLEGFFRKEVFARAGGGTSAGYGMFRTEWAKRHASAEPTRFDMDWIELSY